MGEVIRYLLTFKRVSRSFHPIRQTMHIDRYISGNRIIDLSSKNLVSAYSELLETFSTLLPTPAKRKKVLQELIEREQSLSSYLGEGVRLMHACR